MQMTSTSASFAKTLNHHWTTLLMKTLWKERLYFGGAVRAVKHGHTGTACDIETALCAMEYLSLRASLLENCK
ncbi:unnamed protein product [Strongylus vulgaris]|uniref:Uncharacterized protein n=1 Tax=Strongylus vulgaris TaxID=40348 RepID=A0A3P7JNE7_STRVU|nr:unnamed protein product [Strongylus vulgaris]